MTRDDWDDDTALLADLAAALTEGDAVPSRIAEAGRQAFAWRSIDAELAQLTVQQESAVVRAGPDSPLTLSFEAGPLTIEIEISGSTLRGQLAPPQPGTVEIVGGSSTSRQVSAAADGYFVVENLPATSIRLRVRTLDREVLTPWFSAEQDP